tara:strand:+ start:1313 stop:1945 length:633 start_codon:yes stop_codon:yes gene_type:complete
MSSTKFGLMIVLSSPSGAGKTTLVKLLSKKKNFFVSISHTTRKPRDQEIDGKDYFFVKNNDFKNSINNNEFLEYAKVFNNYYGSPKKKVIEKLEKGINVVFDIDWQGTQKIKNHNLNFELLTIFVLPPSKKELLERLSNRDMKDKLIVNERMKEFKKDLLHWIDYNYVVINDDLDNCFKEICEIIKSKMENSSITYSEDKIKRHVSNLLN